MARSLRMGISTVQSLPSSSATRGRGCMGPFMICGRIPAGTASTALGHGWAGRGSLLGQGQQHPVTSCTARVTATRGQIWPRDWKTLWEHSCRSAPGFLGNGFTILTPQENKSKQRIAEKIGLQENHGKSRTLKTSLAQVIL